MRSRLIIFATTALVAVGAVLSTRPQASKAAPAVAATGTGEELRVDPAARQALFGELHLHTTYSYDAWGIYPSRITPDEAYHFAEGEPVNFLGKMVRRDRPLDFMAVTDHAEFIGVLNQLDDPNNPLSTADTTKGFRANHGSGTFALYKYMHGNVPLPDLNVKAATTDTWAREVAAANANYHPGRFTTFIAYEWTSMPGGDNLHRNVIFSGNRAPQPFTSVDSDRPEDLWSYLERVRGEFGDVIAIPHNANASNGLMFDWVDSDRHPISEGYAQRRALNEPLLEIYQTKGESETHPDLSPADEFANFENWNTLLVGSARSDPHGSYARDALGRGLIIQNRVGANPYKIGFVGASDIHNGISASSENASNGGGSFDPNVNPPSKEEVEQLLTAKHNAEGKRMGTETAGPTTFGSAGLTGVWAEENNRPSIFAALRRRETFATSGTRLRLRFFAGWNYPRGLLQQANWSASAYRDGVPMGGDLPPSPTAGRAPSFLLWAVKDPNDGNLDRIQVVKVWLDKGEYREKVFDVAWSGTRHPDPRTGKLPPVGNTVDLKTATYHNTIGSAALQTVWRDPQFDPSVPAVYYARVLQIPTPRWTTYLAARYGLPLPENSPATIQERGWSSPIWYTPAGKRQIATR